LPAHQQGSQTDGSVLARSGPEFEKRILANEKNNVKFNFLVPTDPYHAYYQLRVGLQLGKAASVGGASDVHYKPLLLVFFLQIKNFSEGKDGEAAKDQAGAAAAAAVAELGKAGAPAPQVIPHALAKLEKPEDEMYTVSISGWRELGWVRKCRAACSQPSH
jgi:splicing factor 3A subunit 1